MDKLHMISPDLTAANIEKLADIFPTVITESVDADGNPVRAVDFDLLRQELSDHIVEGPQERYQLDWPGKRAAAFAANAPIAKTLRPVREESVDFDTTKNLFIEGDNLDALKLLQESYLGKVDLLYIDPPYNTGADLIYKDDRVQSSEDYLTASRQTDSEGRRLVANTSANGRFHSDWLDMIYPRLRLARNLLSPSGMLFISIGDEELAQLRLLCDEVMGQENFIAQLTVEMSTTQGMKVRAAQRGAIVKNSEFILVYSRSAAHSSVPKTPLFDSVSGWPGNFTTWLNDDLSFEPLAQVLNRHASLRAEARRFAGVDEVRTQDLSLLLTCSQVFRDFVEGNLQHIAASDKGMWPNDVPEPAWRDGQAFQVSTNDRSYIIMRSSKGTFRQFLRLSDSYRRADDYASTYGRTVIRGDLWKGFYSDMAHVSLEGGMPFENGKKPVRLLRNLFRWANNSPDALIMDFFAGSGTVADAVWRMNAEDGGRRRVILVQYPEDVASGSSPAKNGYKTISEVGRERLRRSGDAIRNSVGLLVTAPDTGFRSLRVDTSSLSDVTQTAEAMDPDLLADLVETVKPDRTDEDLLFQVLIDWGLDLAESINVYQIEGRRVLSVADDSLIACFADDVTDHVVREVSKRHPLRAVFLDAGFASDAARINAEQIFREVSPETEVRAI